MRLAGVESYALRVHEVLAPPRPESAGRYHRHGQPALYLTSSTEWATIAVSGSVRADGLPRVLANLDASVFRVRFDRLPPHPRSCMRNISPPFGVSVTVALMPGGSTPMYSGWKRRSSMESASVFSTWLMAPPMHDRLPPPNGI